MTLKLEIVERDSSIASVLLRDFENRCAYIFDVNSEKFIDKFTIATFLCPETHKYMQIEPLSTLYGYCVDYVKNLAPLAVTNNPTLPKKSKIDALLVPKEATDTEYNL